MRKIKVGDISTIVVLDFKAKMFKKIANRLFLLIPHLKMHGLLLRTV